MFIYYLFSLKKKLTLTSLVADACLLSTVRRYYALLVVYRKRNRGYRNFCGKHFSISQKLFTPAKLMLFFLIYFSCHK